VSHYIVADGPYIFRHHISPPPYECKGFGSPGKVDARTRGAPVMDQWHKLCQSGPVGIPCGEYNVQDVILDLLVQVHLLDHITRLQDIDRLEDDLNFIIPDNPNQPYDVKDVIFSLVDNGEFLEVHRDFARNIITGYAKFNGIPTGIVANQPSHLAGVLDIDASRKAARFVRLCDCFNIPVVTLVDVPGFLPGSAQEYGGIIIHGAKLMFAYGEATVPKVTITLRKSYGGAHDVMSSKQLRGDINYAWPTAEIAVMGSKGAIEILEGKKLAEIEDHEEKERFMAEKEEEYKKKFANPYEAAKYGYIDDVIEPRNTRFRIIRALQTLSTKKEMNPPKKHPNIPL